MKTKNSLFKAKKSLLKRKYTNKNEYPLDKNVVTKRFIFSKEEKSKNR